MNAALARGRRGYLHRVLAAVGNGGKLTPGVHHPAVEHDRTCGIYRGQDCDCVPNVSVSHPHGEVTVVDQRGNVTRLRKQ